MVWWLRNRGRVMYEESEIGKKKRLLTLRAVEK